MMLRNRIAAGVALLLLAFICGLARADWQKVAPVDWSKIKPSDFRDDELDLPYYLDRFHEMANAVEETGPLRGYINGVFWRAPNVSKPYNARPLESYLTFAYFYCTKRPWNPYYGSPLVRERFEALLNYWLSLQSEDGRFPEYGPKQWGLAPTAFATKFMGETLRLLNSGPPIDPDLLKRVTEADRKAIMATLTMPVLWEHGRGYTNQFCNVFGGAEAYMAIHPDPEMAKLVDEVFRRSAKEFQSPAGFFYERNGADFGYTLHTHHSDQVMAYNYLRGKPLGDLILDEESKWMDWVSYNLLREPDGSTFVINRCIESRQKHAEWPREDSPMSEKVELARAFSSTIEEREAEAKAARAALEKNWPHFEPVDRVGEGTYSPYEFVQREDYSWYPTNAQRDAAVAKLPYIARDTFTHQRSDSRNPLVCTYIRRPSYYAAFDAGTKLDKQQRYGLGLLWNPKTGTVLQSQTASDTDTWGTRGDGEAAPAEAGALDPTYAVGGAEVKPEPGHRDLSAGDVVIKYALGKAAQKTVTFTSEGINVSITHPGSVTEQLPLLTPDGQVKLEPGKATVSFGQTDLTIDFDPSIQAKTQATSVVVAKKHLVVLDLTGHDAMAYRIRFLDHAANQ